jgi:predicted dehydrogenase
MKMVRWGVLSTAKIGLEKVIPAMQKGEYCEMVAIASQSLEREFSTMLVESVKNIRVLDAVISSEESDAWVTLSPEVPPD